MLLAVTCLFVSAAAAEAPLVVVTGQAPTSAVLRAATEVQRYLYVRTRSVPELVPDVPARGDAVVVAEASDSRIIARLDAGAAATARTLGREEYFITTLASPAGRQVIILGGGEAGVQYGAYRFCEHLGVRFYLNGDVVPDTPLTDRIPSVQEVGRPLFAIRGILPFHDFPEGPDWWTRDDYLAHVTQLQKLRMNLLGLHCYPEAEQRVNPEFHAEPLIWIGRERDLSERGEVRASYPAFWAATDRNGHWGYEPMATSTYAAGASEVFPDDRHVHEIFDGLATHSENAEDWNRVFERSADFFAPVFERARSLGIQVAVGTESPLTLPQAVRERLARTGETKREADVVRSLYSGIFRRIKQRYPVDYYWLWTPESWTWSGNNVEQYQATVADLRLAREALRELGDPFRLATSGWVLGPLHDRAALHRDLPADITITGINREVGHDLIDGGFGQLQGRDRWAVPWVENDQNMVGPQSWVGRMRYDAADARRLGCTGLLGLHWRTRTTAPTLAALAAAGWDQSYTPEEWDLRQSPDSDVLTGGRIVRSDGPVTGTSTPEVYVDLVDHCQDLFVVGVPEGRYSLTLFFLEPKYSEAGARVFDVSLQGQVIERDLDIFALAGRNHALERVYHDRRIGKSPLHLAFSARSGGAIIAALGIEGETIFGEPFSQWINLGGGPIGKFTGDYTRDKPSRIARERSMPVFDFYRDFARSSFGETVAEEAARILTNVDGFGLPQSSHWNIGPGAINTVPYDAAAFAFVDAFERLRSAVRGRGNLARFDSWLNTFRYHRALARVGGIRAELDERVHRLRQQTDPKDRRRQAERALEARLQLARSWEEMITLLLACADTTGDWGTIANLEQHSRGRLNYVAFHDERLAAELGSPLPDEARIGRTYRGGPRLLVPTVRTSAALGEPLKLTILALGRTPAQEVTLHWRRFGQTDFQEESTQPRGRAVHEAVLPANVRDLEYYITAVAGDGTRLVWPATAPEMGQTVVRLP